MPWELDEWNDAVAKVRAATDELRARLEGRATSNNLSPDTHEARIALGYLVGIRANLDRLPTAHPLPRVDVLNSVDQNVRSAASNLSRQANWDAAETNLRAALESLSLVASSYPPASEEAYSTELYAEALENLSSIESLRARSGELVADHEQLVGVATLTELTHRYDDQADRAAKASWAWGVVFLLLLLAVVAVGIWADPQTWSDVVEDPEPDRVRRAALFAGPLGVGAFTVARRWSDSRRRALQARDISLRLSTANPYFARLSDEEREAALKTLGIEILGKPGLTPRTPERGA